MAVQRRRVGISWSLMSVSSGCGNSKEHISTWRSIIQLHTNINTQATVICNDVWLASTVSHHHNYDCTLCYSYFLKCVSHNSSQGLHRADWTWCQVEYYNEQRINNSERSINRRIFMFCPESNSGPPAVCETVWSGQWSPESCVSPPDEQISLTTRWSPAILHSCSCVQHRPGASSFFCVSEHASSWEGSITISDSRGQAWPASCRKGHLYMKR